MKRFMFFAAVPILLGMALTAITHAQNWESTDGPWRADVRDLTAGRLSSSTQVTLYISDASSIYRSTNSAGSWSATTSPGGNPLAITCKPDDPNVVLAGINNFLKRSVNGGSFWETKIQDPNFHPLRLATSPASTVRMYAGLEKVAGFSSMRRSTNEGQNWTSVNYFFSGVQTDLTALAPHPTDALKVWAGGTTPTVLEPPQNFQYTFTNGVFSSTDGGATWTNTGDLAKNVVALAAYTRSSTTYIFAGTTDGSNKLYKTTNNGTTWSLVSSYAGGLVKDIATRDDGTYQTIFVASDNGVYVSTDNGTSWSSSCAGIYNKVLDRVVVISEGSPSNAQLVFAGGDGSLFKSTNSGSTWTDVGKPASVPTKSFGTAEGKMNVTSKAADRKR